jgi:hypothetical protein
MVDEPESKPVVPQPYRLSGQRDSRSWLLFAAVPPSAFVFGACCGQFEPHVESMKLKFLIAAGIGLALGGACFWLSKELNCRSVRFITIASATSALCLVYSTACAMASEIVQITSITAPVSYWDLLLNPLLLQNTLSKIAAAGVFFSGSRPASPGSLWAEWGIRGICTIIVVIATTITAFRQLVYCETCRRWLDIKRKSFRFPNPADKADAARLLAGDLSVLRDQAQQRAPFPNNPPYVRLDFVVCGICGNTGVYRLASIVVADEWKNPDTPQPKEAHVTPLMELTPDAASCLGALLARDRETRGIPRLNAKKPNTEMKKRRDGNKRKDDR